MKIPPLLRITLAIFTIAFFLIRPYFLQSRGMWYMDDDYDYFAHSSSLAFGQYPSYNKEFFTIGGGKGEPQSAIGTGILAAPFVFVFSLLDRVEGSTITQVRTQDNITGSWSQFGFVVASVFYFTLACYLLFSGISLFVAPVHAETAVIIMMICQGLPLFVYRRPFFSHCSEFFLQCLLMYLFLKNRKDPSVKVLTGVMALSALLYLTRPNDVAFALVWPFLVMDYSKGIFSVLRQACSGILLFTGLILVFKIWPDAVSHMHPYSWADRFIGRHITFFDLYRRIVHILIGTDWGLFFTAPFLIISFGGMFLLKGLFKRFVWLLVPIAINFYVAIVWGAQGGWYGYRYLIISAIPVMALPLAFLLEWVSKKINLWVIPLITLLSLPPVLSMIAFERCSYFNLQLCIVDFNVQDWTNPAFQINIWGMLTHVPGAFCLICSESVLELFYSITGKFPPLTQTTWVRIFIILLIPCLVYLICIFRRKIIK